MFSIAIPSYKRPDTLGKKTLKALRDEGFLPTQITVFVANEDERRLYEAALDPSLYGSLVVGVVGLAAQRQFISEHYPLGQPLLQIDDDIRRFKKLGPYHLPTLFQQAFEYCQTHAIPLWGLYPTHSTLFMKRRFKLGCFNLVGSCFGLLNTRDVSYTVEEDERFPCCKEDYFRAFTLYRQAQKLFRLDMVSVDTTYWGGGGGLNLTRTLEQETAACASLCRLFPEYVKDTYVKKNGHHDIHLRKLPFFYLPPDTLAETGGR
jgi:hypothetical protein